MQQPRCADLPPRCTALPDAGVGALLSFPPIDPLPDDVQLPDDEVVVTLIREECSLMRQELFLSLSGACRNSTAFQLEYELTVERCVTHGRVSA